MHRVKCYYCQETFDRDKEDCAQVSSKRYCHKKCLTEDREKQLQEEKDLKELEDYIKELFNQKTISTKVRKQIKDFRTINNYTYSGILKTLIYWYKIKENSKEKSNNGIGIVPYIYEEAFEYYYKIFLVQSINEANNIDNFKQQIIEVEISPPSVEVDKIKLFNI